MRQSYLSLPNLLGVWSLRPVKFSTGPIGGKRIKWAGRTKDAVSCCPEADGSDWTERERRSLHGEKTVICWDLEPRLCILEEIWNTRVYVPNTWLVKSRLGRVYIWRPGMELRDTSGILLERWKHCKWVPSTKQGSFMWYVIQTIGVKWNSMATIHREESMAITMYVNTEVPKRKNKRNSKRFLVL